MGTVRAAVGETDAVAALARWQRAGHVIAEVRREELRRLTDAELLAAADELLDLPCYLPARAGLSGLVEQQRLFARVQRPQSRPKAVR